MRYFIQHNLLLSLGHGMILLCRYAMDILLDIKYGRETMSFRTAATMGSHRSRLSYDLGVKHNI